MSTKNSEIGIVFHGFKKLGGEKNTEEFFMILKKLGEKFLPSKISIDEPIKTLYSIETAKKLWIESEKDGLGGGVIFKGKTVNQLYGSVDWRNDSANSISLHISTKLLSPDSVEKVIKMAKEIFIWSNAVYGYGYHSSQRGIHYTPGISYRTCIGGITWMAIFGPPYVEMFGREVLQSAPCIVDEFSADRFMLLTSKEPREPDQEILDIQQKVQKHLGTDAFFRQEDKKQLFGRTFTMEEIIAGKDELSIEGYRHPDFSKHIEKSNEEQPRVIYEIKDDGSTKVTFVKP
jgi:hypothetical protein